MTSLGDLDYYSTTKRLTTWVKTLPEKFDKSDDDNDQVNHDNDDLVRVIQDNDDSVQINQSTNMDISDRGKNSMEQIIVSNKIWVDK